MTDMELDIEERAINHYLTKHGLTVDLGEHRPPQLVWKQSAIEEFWEDYFSDNVLHTNRYLG